MEIEQEKKKSLSKYEEENILNQYILFHYGEEEEILPYSFGPKDALYFPVRCVRECLNIEALPSRASALELGCAVGRSSLELSRYCDRVTAIDNSRAFISVAKEMQEKGFINYAFAVGNQKRDQVALLPKDVYPEKILFECKDVANVLKNPHKFDVVLAANLLCRLPDPKDFLLKISQLVAPFGQLILTSPYFG